jgi:PAS domain S-box-containing protein
MQTSAVSVKSILIRVIVATTLGILVLACLGLFFYDRHQQRQQMSRSVGTAARIVAGNSAAALLLGDQEMASQVLATATAEPEVASAALFDSSGMIFAIFPPAKDAAGMPDAIRADDVSADLADISILQPVLHKGQLIGTLFIKGNPKSVYQPFSTYALMVIGVAVASGGLAYMLSKFLSRRISQPLERLSEISRAVSTDKNYSLRATKVSADEFGKLTDAFNLMLDEIQVGNAALRSGEERFRTLADNMAQLAWMADPDGTVTWYNKRWYDYTGCGPSRPMEGAMELVHPEHAERVATKFRSCVEEGSVWQDTLPLRGRDGTYRWFLAHALPIRGAQDKVIRWFGTNTDITELRETQQELRRTRDEAVAASHAKDEFLATLSHELRTPLNPVLLLVSDTQRCADLPNEIRDDYEMIRKHVELEARLIDDMLDLTIITRGKVVLERRPISLHEVVRDALKTVESDRMAKRIEMVVQLDAREPMVLADPVRLQQVLWNVIKNAIKFSAPGGIVTVRSRLLEEEGNWIIDVTDRGIGMMPAEIARAFDAFVQGNHATGGGSHRFGGLGLGLAISRKLMELHDGRISATSAGMGQGSTFTLAVPMLRAEQATALRINNQSWPSDQRAKLAGQGLDILLVEDHGPTRIALERLLVRRGHHVASAGSLAEARALARVKRFNLLVSDIGLPDGNGYELMGELRVSSDIIGLALTGYGTEADIALAKEAGFTRHLTKPVRAEHLDRELNFAVAAITPSLAKKLD